MSREITPVHIAAMRERLNRLTPDSERQWGTMTPNECLTHLTDALRHPIGERPAVLPPRSWFRHVPLKWLVLWVLPRNPRGVKTRPGADPKLEGTKPVEFARDLAELNRVTNKYLAMIPEIHTEHTRFGPMRERDWLRWWWMHMDHHMRQFGL